MFANIFGDKKVNIQIIKETVAWWLQGVQLPSKNLSDLYDVFIFYLQEIEHPSNF